MQSEPLRDKRGRPFPTAPTEEMDAVFALCRKGKWEDVYLSVAQNPYIATTPMTMDNHIQTTVLHQAITSKGDVKQRKEVILSVLARTPEAAQMVNGYGSLPLHVVAQRNTKMTAEAKEIIMSALVDAYPEALIVPGGVGKRTPLHIIFTGKFRSDQCGFPNAYD
jgi:hypothetical protein